MSAIERQLAEDRALRDAARRLFDADVAFIREDLGQRSAGRRVLDRAADATLDTADDALAFAGEHRTALVATVAVIVAWFARRPICKGLSRLRESIGDRFR